MGVRTKRYEMRKDYLTVQIGTSKSTYVRESRRRSQRTDLPNRRHDRPSESVFHLAVSAARATSSNMPHLMLVFPWLCPQLNEYTTFYVCVFPRLGQPIQDTSIEEKQMPLLCFTLSPWLAQLGQPSLEYKTSCEEGYSRCLTTGPGAGGWSPGAPAIVCFRPPTPFPRSHRAAGHGGLVLAQSCPR